MTVLRVRRPPCSRPRGGGVRRERSNAATHVPRAKLACMTGGCGLSAPRATTVTGTAPTRLPFGTLLPIRRSRATTPPSASSEHARHAPREGVVTHAHAPAPSGESAALSRDLADFLIELSIALHKNSIYPSGHPLLGGAVDALVLRLVRLLQDRTLVVARRCAPAAGHRGRGHLRRQLAPPGAGAAAAPASPRCREIPARGRA